MISGIIKYGLIVVAIGLSSSCKKTDDTAPEPTISINILSPTEGAVYQQGDTVQVTAEVNSPVDVHGYEWTVKLPNGSQLKTNGDHSHGKQFTISGNFVNTVDSTTSATLEVTVEINHEGNESKKQVSFTLNQ